MSMTVDLPRRKLRLLPPPGQPAIDVAEHLGRYGPLPYRGGHGLLIDDVRASGLTGRGGAAFPVHRKLTAVHRGGAAGGRPIVVANGAEGEPASAKDKSLLLLAPHMVLDGIQLAAEAVGADNAVLYVGIDQLNVDWLTGLITQRRSAGIDRVPVRLAAAPPRFIAGQESALANRISGKRALPSFTPPRVYERGVDGRPTLVQNVETLAHMSLIGRYGPSWFRAVGTPDEPGTAICTLRQADGRVDLTEAPLGTPLTSLLDLRRCTAVLVGGYHGAWLPAATAAELTLSNADLRPHGASVGAGVLAALPADRCGLRETARVTRYLALESAGQCGPCRNGLPRIAGSLAELADVTPGRRPDPELIADLRRWAGLVERRGACAHPDGTVRFVASALRTFGAEVGAHLRGYCTKPNLWPFLPVSAQPIAEKDWW
jgi:NADH:ubiquinone oxidoreductase subunit F (NADH-binding)